MSKFTQATPEFVASQIEYYSTDVEYHQKQRQLAADMLNMIQQHENADLLSAAKESAQRDKEYHLEREQRAQMWLDILYSAQDYKAEQAY